jgi:hypothetical protein
MSQLRKSITGLWATIMTVALLAAIAVWQFYLFVNFKATSGILDVQGGRGHLWLAIIAAAFACFAAFFVFSAFLNHDREDVIHITSISG